MSDEQYTNSFRKEFEASLNSPLTILARLRNLIFGTKKPDLYTQFSFYLGLTGWCIFFLWSVMGSVAIRMREVIVDNKEVDVMALLEQRAAKLGFGPGSFIGRLEAFYALSIGFWIVVFAGLVLMWRKQFRFIWFYFSGTICYLVFMWAMLGFSYFRQDTTLFDKVALFTMIAHTALYAYFLSQEIKGDPIRLFGLDPEEED